VHVLVKLIQFINENARNITYKNQRGHFAILRTCFLYQLVTTDIILCSNLTGLDM
jgi:hypothetical protein